MTFVDKGTNVTFAYRVTAYDRPINIVSSPGTVKFREVPLRALLTSVC